MPNSEPLVMFGVMVCIIVGAFLVIPILRGSREILTSWNAMLVGIIVFTGLGSIEVRYVDAFAWESLNWFQPTVKEMKWYMWASGVAIASLMGFFYLNSWAKAWAQRRMRKWPEMSVPLTLFVIGFCFMLIIASLTTRTMTFFGPLTLNLALIGAPAACVFAFAMWNRNKINIGWLLIFIAVFAGCLLYAMLISGGRRPVLSMFLGPVLCIYGAYGRTWSRPKLFITLGLGCLMVFSVGVIYAKFRWYNTTIAEKRSTSGLMEQIRKVRTQGELFSNLTKSGISYFGQNNALFGMLTQRYVEQGALTPIPLNSLRFLISYPIPRKLWPTKPEVVGIKVVRDTSHIPGTNWGLGFAGQGAYEGGIPVLVLYSFLLAILLRFLDEPFRLQPNNPFLIYMQATVIPHVVGIPRGDMASMVQQALQGVLFVLILGYVCRAIFGTREAPFPQTAAPMLPPNVAYPVMPRQRVTR